MPRGSSFEQLAAKIKDTRKIPGVPESTKLPAVKTSQNSGDQLGNQLATEAVLVSALESMTRYKAKLKRDLYRAIDMLRKLQAEREKASGDNSL